jgi:DNA-binding beta-propeller fold protein YncE
MALAGGALPETVCSHLGGAGGGAFQLMQFLDSVDAARLQRACSELRDMVAAYRSFMQRIRGASWQWPLRRLRGQVTTVAGGSNSGSQDGQGAAASFHELWHLAVRPDGTLLVSDHQNNCIREVSPSSGEVRTLACTGEPLLQPAGLALGPDGSLFVSLWGKKVVCKVSAAGHAAVVAGGSSAGASLGCLRGLAVTAQGSVLICDSGRNLVRCLSAEGRLSTVVGREGKTGAAGGPALSATLSTPTSVALLADGGLLICDIDSDTVKHVSAGWEQEGLGGSVVSIKAGTPSGTGTLEDFRFNRPFAAAVDCGGSVYVSDRDNQRIMCIQADGSVSTVAGTDEEMGCKDGLGAEARFCRPRGLAFGPDGSLYVADRCAIRRIT